MALSPIYYARGDQSNANNAEVNVVNANTVPTTSLQFTSGTGGDLLLDFVADGGDTNTLPEFDPDTQVIIGGNTYNFAFVKSGTLPTSGPGVNSVPVDLRGDTVYVIKVDLNGDGDLDDAGDRSYFFTLSPDGTFANMSAIGNGALTLGAPDLDPPPEPVCLCAGTFVQTPSGSRAVETLRAGDLVLNDAGDARQIVWIGHTRLSLANLIAHPQHRPIRIAAGAFGSNLPERDLLVSPQHRVVIEGALADLLFAEDRVLVAAKHLVGTLAEQTLPVADVVYYHILLQDHELLVTNGLVTESFQPARRMIEVMSDEMQAMLLSVIEALGAEHMLTRKDALRSLTRAEAELLGHLNARSLAQASGRSSAAGSRRSSALSAAAHT